jgi:hypothetical protein
LIGRFAETEKTAIARASGFESETSDVNRIDIGILEKHDYIAFKLPPFLFGAISSESKISIPYLFFTPLIVSSLVGRTQKNV